MRKRIELNTNNMTFDRGYDEFIFNCKARNLRPATIKFYDNSMMSIYKFIHPKTLIRDINKSMVDSFVLYCQNELEIKDTTINTYLRALKSVLYYFMKLGYMEKFHISEVKFDKPIIETYTEFEVKLLLKKPNLKNSTFIEYRNWVICNFLYGTGIRCSNLVELKIKDLDLHNNIVYFKTTKNRKPLMLPLTKSLIPILRGYLDIRGGTEEDYLFPTAYGDKVNRNTLNGSLRDYNRKRGVNKTGIHRWRHTFARNWIINHGSILELQKILNHSDLEMVRNYVTIFTSDLQKDFDYFNPLENLHKQSIKIKK